MKISLDDGWMLETADPIDISIPLNFNGPQPNAFGVEKAVSRPCVADSLVGDTRLGGSCNFEQYTFIPQCNGTHTECVGHLTHERISIRESLQDVFMTATLITLVPDAVAGISERYAVPYDKKDRVISRSLIQEALRETLESKLHEALIVRTQPNGADKLNRTYSGDPMPAYFTNDAMQFIVECGVEHLLVDLPSIDRIHDEGKLSNHRIFWNLEPGSFELKDRARANSTITEMIYVPNEIDDGNYVLNLQIAPFTTDASPSRPLLFKLQS